MATSSPPLSETNPELLAFWDYERNHTEGWSPNKLQAGSGKHTHWKHWHETVLPTGEEWAGWHEWTRSVQNQKKYKSCPVCEGQTILKGFNDIFTRFPHLEEEWDVELNNEAGIDPYVIKPGNKAHHAHWKHWHETTLLNGKKWAGWHKWEMSPNSRTHATTPQSCPICGKTKLLKGYNDLATTHPHLLKEWDYKNNPDVKPEEIFAGTHSYVNWQCTEGHTWKAKTYARAYIGSGCPKCKGRISIPGKTDLATLYPEIAKQWHPTKNGKLIPSEFLVSSGMIVWWAHELPDGSLHEWESPVSYRTSNKKKTKVDGTVYDGDGCPVCLNRRLIPGVNDLATLYPEIAKMWHPTMNGDLKPSEVTAGGVTQYWWQHEADEKTPHEWKASPENIVNNGGCIRCLRGSIAERELADFISSELNVLVKTSVRNIIQHELDIYIPSKNLAIEFNGLYWHSDAMGKDRNYHYNKYQACKDKGIQLIQIWEDDWRENKTFIKQALIHKLQENTQPSVGARKLKPVNLNYAASAAFLSVNHIQGPSTGTKYYGLTSPETGLRAAIVLKRNGNKGHEGEWLIERYATSGPTPGGFTKLLKYAERDITATHKSALTQWVTFSDNCISDGGLYANNGFTLDKELDPDYMYLKNGNRIHKFNYRLKRFREDPNLLWDETLSEKGLAKLNNIHRIWDAGKIRWIKTIPAATDSQ